MPCVLKSYRLFKTQLTKIYLEKKIWNKMKPFWGGKTTIYTKILHTGDHWISQCLHKVAEVQNYFFLLHILGRAGLDKVRSGQVRSGHLLWNHNWRRPWGRGLAPWGAGWHRQHRDRQTDTGWAYYSYKVFLILKMAKICQVIWKTK